MYILFQVSYHIYSLLLSRYERMEVLDGELEKDGRFNSFRDLVNTIPLFRGRLSDSFPAGEFKVLIKKNEFWANLMWNKKICIVWYTVFTSTLICLMLLNSIKDVDHVLGLSNISRSPLVPKASIYWQSSMSGMSCISLKIFIFFWNFQRANISISRVHSEYIQSQKKDQILHGY